MKTNHKIALMAAMAIIFTSAACSSGESEKKAASGEKAATEQSAVPEEASDNAGGNAGSAQPTAFTGKYWYFESSTVEPAIDLDMDGKADTDIRTLLEDCDKDDAEMYKADGKIVKDFGAVKCDEDDTNGKEVGSWTYNSATRQITSKHDDTDKPQTVSIKEISGNKMILTYTFTSSKGDHIITAVFKAK